MDHRTIGKQLKLYFWDDSTPGSCIFLPHGTRIYNKLKDLIKNEYVKRDFNEVITPILYKNKLWKISNHFSKYKDNMFFVECENKEIYGIKPMNCCSHCLIYKHELRSYKDLPIRYADFGVLHRNELSGSLTGLFRCRKFQQDDAHIFCRKNQIENEIKKCLEFLEFIYKIFNFQLDIELSTRPNNYVGDLNLWNTAENILQKILNSYKIPNNIKKGEGSFYGPKIDIHIKDNLGKKYQCGTIQLDFQLPILFELEYKNEFDKIEIPVIIHRAIYGSFERFIGILVEHYQGKFPFWLSPRQLIILPVSIIYEKYAKNIYQSIKNKGYYIDYDESNNRLNKKILNAEKLKYNYIIVIGNKEMKNKTINVREQFNKETEKKLEDFFIELKKIDIEYVQN